MHEFDIIAIGGGAAGLVTAAGAAGLGARVALIERHKMGGECLWTGCVPSKALLAAARAMSDARQAGRYGINVAAPTVDFARVMKHVHAAQEAIEPNDSPARFRSLGVDVIIGNARFVDKSRVYADGREMKARHLVIATGSRPAIPEIPGIDTVPYYTNETIFSIQTLPASMIVLGGGAVGVELAQAFALLGSRVTILEADRQILRTEDAEVAEAIHSGLTQDGVDIRIGAKVTSIQRTNEGVRVTTDAGTLDAATLLVAVGRQANTDTLDLEAAGVEYDTKGLKLDKYLRTTAHNIWGVGDVTGAPRFTHVADYQARLVLRNALFPLKTAADYNLVPWAIYTDPEIGHVGLTEAQAREQHSDAIQIFRKSFAELDRAIADGKPRGFIKIIADRRGKILGGHVVGAHASSVLGEIALAMKHNIGMSQVSAMMHAYPTYGEAFKHTGDAFVRTRFQGLTKQIAGWLVRR